MNIRRLIPVVASLLLVASAFGGPALAQDSDDGTQSADYEEHCEEKYDDPAKQEECKQAYERQSSEDQDGYDWTTRSGSDDGSDGSSDSSPRWDYESDDRKRSGDDDRRPDAPEPRPVVMEIPSDVAPDVDERRQFFQQQAQEHREFHRQQQEARQDLFENQSQERDAFLRDLAERCLNATVPADADLTVDDLRAQLDDEEDNETAECMRDLRAFLMEQQEERRDLLDDQREAHETFHQELQEEREAFIEEQRQAAQERAEQARERWNRSDADDEPRDDRRFGAFEASDGQVQGTFVSFNYTADPAALADVAVKGVPLFDAAALDGTASQRFRGAHFALAGDAGALVIHDNPAVAFQIQPRDDASWVLNLAGHLTVNATEDDERWRVTDGGSLHGVLLFEDDPTYDDLNKTFTGDDGVRFVVLPEEASGPGVADDGSDSELGTTSEEDEIGDAKREALTEGTLGAEVNLASGDEGIEDQTVVYDDLDVSLEETASDKVRFVVDGELETGRTVVVNADPGLFEGDRLSVSYHDIYENGTEEEVPIRLASTVQDVMNPNDDSTPEYLPAKGADGWQIMVSIPHFSAHAVTIQSVTSQAPPSIMAGALAAVGFLAFAGANLFRRSGGRP